MQGWIGFAIGRANKQRMVSMEATSRAIKSQAQIQCRASKYGVLVPEHVQQSFLKHKSGSEAARRQPGHPNIFLVEAVYGVKAGSTPFPFSNRNPLRVLRSRALGAACIPLLALAVARPQLCARHHHTHRIKLHSVLASRNRERVSHCTIGVGVGHEIRAPIAQNPRVNVGVNIWDRSLHRSRP